MNAMLAEYSYIWSERNLSASGEDEEGNEDEFTWVDLPDWDNPGKVKRYKKYKDVGSKLGVGGNM